MLELQSGDPRRIGQYELLGRLGAGGMGQVYLATGPHGLVAVKVIHPALARDDQFRARFRHEVAHGRRIGRSWAAAVLDADHDAPRPWLATAYVPGPSLQNAVATLGPLPVDTVHHLGAALAEALAHVHSAGLVHRDVKPSNVLLGPEGPHLIDLGIARSLDGTQLTASGVVVGTPAFMSPEQAEGAQSGPPSDVFSLGSVLTFAATGQGPFRDSSPYAVLVRITDDPPDLTGLPEPLHTVVEACLAKRPEDRPATVRVVEMLGPVPPVPATGWLPAPVAALDPTPLWLDRTVVDRTNTDRTNTDRTVPGASVHRHGSTALLPPEPVAAPRRIDRRLLLGGAGVLAVAALAGTVVAALPRPSPVAPPPPPTPARPLSTAAAVPRPAELWSAPGIRAPDVLVVAGDALYAGGAGGVVAVDARSGAERWRFEAPPGGAGISPDAVGVAVDAGTVHVATRGAVHALDSATGALRWRTPLTARTARGSLVGVDVGAGGGRVYATVGDQLVSLDPASGQVRWSHTVLTTYATSPTVTGDRCLVTAGAGVDAVADGRVLWRHADAREYATDITVAGGTAFLVVNDDAGTLTALDTATGAVRWTTAMGAQPDRMAPPAVTAGVVFVLGGEQVHAFDAGTGARRWTAPDRSTGAGTVERTPIAAGGLVYSSSSNGRVYAFDAATGAVRWLRPPGDSDPWVIGTGGDPAAGTVFVASLDGTLHALGTP